MTKRQFDILDIPRVLELRDTWYGECLKCTTPSRPIWISSADGAVLLATAEMTAQANTSAIDETGRGSACQLTAPASPEAWNSSPASAHRR